jgi:hypothetical protein
MSGLEPGQADNLVELVRGQVQPAADYAHGRPPGGRGVWLLPRPPPRHGGGGAAGWKPYPMGAAALAAAVRLVTGPPR